MAKKPAVPIEIIPNMYDLGMFKKTLSSRKRLRLTALFSVLGLSAAFFGVGYFLRNISIWSGINIVLIVMLFLGGIFVSYIVALAIGDSVFAGPWRKKMMLGKNYIPETLEEQTALLKNKNIFFLLIWCGAIVAILLGCDFCTGGSVRWYQKFGGTIVSMKSPDASDRLFILKTISNPYYSEKWKNDDIRDHVRQLILDENPEVQQWAAYLAGRAKISEASEELIAVLKNDRADTISRREAAIALGRMDWKPARAPLFLVLKKEFAKNHRETELVPATLYAFYSMKDSMAAPETIQMLKICLEQRDCSSQILQYAFFYLKSLKVKDAAALSFNYLDTPAITAEERCYASDILRFTSSKTDVARIKQEFDKTPSDVECPVVYRKYHEEPAIILFERDPLRALYLRSVGNQMDPGDYDWIWAVGSNVGENAMTRKVAETYTRAMQERGIVK